MFYIYGLHLEGEEEIRYVGSSKDITRRFWGHLNEYKTKDSDKNTWVKENKERVRVKVLQEVVNDHKLAERKMIDKLQRQGHRLFNVRHPRRLTSEERMKVYKALAGDD